jgi:hypothetical protein
VVEVQVEVQLEQLKFWTSRKMKGVGLPEKRDHLHYILRPLPRVRDRGTRHQSQDDWPVKGGGRLTLSFLNDCVYEKRTVEHVDIDGPHTKD